MLGLRQFICFWFVLANVCAWAIENRSHIPYVHLSNNSDQEFLDVQALMVSETDLMAMIDHFKQLKVMCETRNIEFPNLTVLLTAIRNHLALGSLEIDDATFDWLYEEFRTFEEFDCVDWDPIKHKNRHKKHRNKEVKISTKTALGFLKFMGGTLMCIIPVPLVQGAGAALAVVGISDMVDGCHKEDHCSSSEEKLLEIQRKSSELAGPY